MAISHRHHWLCFKDAIYEYIFKKTKVPKGEKICKKCEFRSFCNDDNPFCHSHDKCPKILKKYELGPAVTGRVVTNIIQYKNVEEKNKQGYDNKSGTHET